MRNAKGERVRDNSAGGDGTGRGKAVEVTSKTADKSAQLDKEARIRAAGGKYVRDPKTKQLIEVKDASRVIRVD